MIFDDATTERIHRAVEDNPYAEPVQVASNVKHGFGVFGGFNRKSLDVRIRDDFRRTDFNGVGARF